MKELKTTLYFCVLLWSFQHGSCIQNYDFIIAGGGTGGLALARRLAESGKHSVLVLETGDVPKPGMDVPAFAPNFISDHDVIFNYESLPQSKAGQDNPDGVLSVVTGKVLSGTSNLNYMWFNRGSPHDYNNWAKLTNDSSWNYANMMPYFKRIEAYKGTYPSDQHGYEGPITVSMPEYTPGLAEWLEAGRELGYQVLDPNGPQKKSFAKVEYAKNFGRRSSSFKGYIEPILDQNPNLKIILNTNVTKVLFRGKRAIGVQVKSTSPSPEINTTEYTAIYANKEIIISAGAFGSPLILQRSGIGPKQLLKSAGIPVIQELPVGENFQDHVSVNFPIILSTNSVLFDGKRDLTPGNWNYYLKTGDGPFSTTLASNAQAFVVSSEAEANGEGHWPDIHITPGHSVDTYRSAGFSNDSLAPWEGPMTCPVFLTRPYSRGRVQINPKNPEGPPLFQIGLLTDKRDIQKLVDGLKEAFKIYEDTLIYKKLGARIPPVATDECGQFRYRSDEYLQCYIKYKSVAGWHPAGTCKMGSGQNDSTAVVDSQLRVIGLEGLRVVDASIMPTVTNANTHAAVYAIAEKASDMISKSDYPASFQLVKRIKKCINNEPRRNMLRTIPVPGLNFITGFWEAYDQILVK